MTTCDPPILIVNGLVVNEDDLSKKDVLIENGVIKEIAPHIAIPPGTRVIDAKDKYVIPGGIDPHTHFEVEFMGAISLDDFYHGTKAAIAGGTTTIIDFAVPTNRSESLINCYMRYRRKADCKVCCDYGLHAMVTRFDESVQNEMTELGNKYGVNSFKVLMAHDNYSMNDGDIYSTLEHCKNLGAVPMIHAENGLIIKQNVLRLLKNGITGPEGHWLSRPEEVEAEAVNRACVIANQVKSPLYVVHMMSRSAVQTLVRYSEKNDYFIGETLATALGRDSSNCQVSKVGFKFAAGHILSPPLSPDPCTKKFLIDALALDDLQLTGSDNCTFTTAQKEMGKEDFSKIPQGVNGVEDRMSITWEKGVTAGVMSPSRFVAITSTNAAKIFNLYPKKGCIEVGSDADVVIWNGTKTRVISAKTHNHAVDFNIFEGMTVHGVPEYVIVRGRVCVDNGKLIPSQGFGRFLPMALNSPFIYTAHKMVRPIKSFRRQ